MANETNNNTAETNETSEGNLTAILDTVEESGLLDTLRMNHYSWLWLL